MGLLAAACDPGIVARRAAASPAPAPPPTASPEGGPGSGPALEHLRRWSERIIQGGQPAGDAAFRQLEALGVTTILSVDGALPDVEGAARHGLGYVHVPVGYDGITPDEQARIVKAVEESRGPVYIHCHHGLHRGPAAAAIARQAVDGVSAGEAYAGLQASGCSPSYDGLYAAVRDFVPPNPDQLAALPPLPSAVRPQGIRDTMVHVDGGWDYVTALEANAWAAPSDAPDRTPDHELTILRERFRELARQDEAQAEGDAFLASCAAMEERLAALDTALATGDKAAAGPAFDAVAAACQRCHANYRD